MKPLAITDKQLDLLTRACAALPEQQRRQFVADVASRLGSAPGNHAFRRAINTELARRCARGNLHAQFKKENKYDATTPT